MKVTPKARRRGISRVENGLLKIDVPEPPADGAANKGVIKLLSEVLGIPRSDLVILVGAGSRRKQILATSVSLEQVKQRLAQHGLNE
ncbi:DUF167 domain-containing protein [bacterium]|nr:DUF167 domain-containing protein [candidate division CSSED10-310 bacterium]